MDCWTCDLYRVPDQDAPGLGREAAGQTRAGRVSPQGQLSWQGTDSWCQASLRSAPDVGLQRALQLLHCTLASQLRPPAIAHYPRINADVQRPALQANLRCVRFSGITMARQSNGAADHVSSLLI